MILAKAYLSKTMAWINVPPPSGLPYLGHGHTATRSGRWWKRTEGTSKNRSLLVFPIRQGEGLFKIVLQVKL